MTVQISIIGLGQIGASIGLALAGQPDRLRRVGHDKSIEAARKAEKLGALDKVEINLHNAVRGADLVILALPMDQIRSTLELIAIDLKEGAVVMDTGPVKQAVVAWAGEVIPHERYYVGLTPVLNPVYLQGFETGPDAAHADLFKGGVVAIVAPPRTDSNAIKLATDLVQLLGATPLFADPLEVDSLMAATHLLPQLMASALLSITVNRPGWMEGRKIAGRHYASVAGPMHFLPGSEALRSAVLLNRENTLRMLDAMIASLQEVRTEVDTQQDQALEERFQQAMDDWAKWWGERQASEWRDSEAFPADNTLPRQSIFGNLFGFGNKPKPPDKSKK